jgi:hypothetical protein
MNFYPGEPLKILLVHFLPALALISFRLTAPFTFILRPGNKKEAEESVCVCGAGASGMVCMCVRRRLTIESTHTRSFFPNLNGLWP